jgi:hypothetical protein
MATINEGLDAFCKVHEKYHLGGSIDTAPSEGVSWPKDLPVSDELKTFYLRNPKGIKFETGFVPRQIFDVENLEEGQVGYLWTCTTSGRAVNKDWEKENLVFIDSAGGDPIIAVTGQEKTPVYAAYDAAEPFKISDSLGDFLLAISRLIDIVYGEFEVFELSDDDGLSDIFIKRASDEIKPILGQENFERFIDYFYG